MERQRCLGWSGRQNSLVDIIDFWLPFARLRDGREARGDYLRDNGSVHSSMGGGNCSRAVVMTRMRTARSCSAKQHHQAPQQGANDRSEFGANSHGAVFAQVLDSPGGRLSFVKEPVKVLRRRDI